MKISLKELRGLISDAINVHKEERRERESDRMEILQLKRENKNLKDKIAEYVTKESELTHD